MWLARQVADPDFTSLESDDTAVFMRLRPKLFGIAYRMLGSIGDADDIVQDAWIRWQSTDRDAVADPTAFLVTVTTRLCINELKSARVRRETYIGPWLPEPVDTSSDPALGAERAEALHMATLMLLQKLTGAERASYILREAFDYPYSLIAEVIDVSEANARQLVSRARKHLDGDRQESVDTTAHRRLLESFVTAARTGGMDALEALLAQHVTSHTDGNGVRNASRVLVHGRTTVARFILSFQRHFWQDTRLVWQTANDRPSVLVVQDQTVRALLTVEASSDGIEDVIWVMAPEKLTAVAAAAGLNS
jgi:RNA polymerase sigma-70 factor (ECF subfamily)